MRCAAPDPAPADARLASAAAERNAAPILAELQRLLPQAAAAGGTLLEIASGSGQHAACFAAALPQWRWLPSDVDARARASIAAWCAGLPNVAPPLALDIAAEPWAGVPATVDAILCINLVHIAPWDVSSALMRGAARRLAPQGLLVTYGPYLEDGVPTAPSNLAFDAELRARDPRWGLRRVAELAHEAGAVGLALRERVAMPANNLLLAWARG
ncbi:MAG: DUF938 domain-containing protein [Burkholderiales bacterium]|nr:DUF938 domain-containing protein [Burkholderiales bacterium]